MPDGSFQSIRYELEHAVADVSELRAKTADVFCHYQRVAEEMLRKYGTDFRPKELSLFLDSLLYERSIIFDQESPTNEFLHDLINTCPQSVFPRSLTRRSPTHTRVTGKQWRDYMQRTFAKSIRLELVVRGFLQALSKDYRPGELAFFLLNHHSCYVAPKTDQIYSVTADTGWQGVMSAHALGISATLQALSFLSFSVSLSFSEACDSQYAQLLQWARQHPESSEILETTR